MIKQILLKRFKQKFHNKIQSNLGNQSLYDDIGATRCQTAFHGTEYGGWVLCPEGLSSSTVVYSFGIGEDASFDLEVIKIYEAEVHAFDPTPRSINWVEKQSWPSRFHFYPIGVGNSERIADFYPPKNPDHISHTILTNRNTTQEPCQVQIMRLKTIARMLNHKVIDILKMDIEGAEYEVIDDLVRTPELRVNQILVEFHHFFPEVNIESTKEAIQKLSLAGYKLFSLSNRGFEFSFILK